MKPVGLGEMQGSEEIWTSMRYCNGNGVDVSWISQ